MSDEAKVRRVRYVTLWVFARMYELNEAGLSELGALSEVYRGQDPALDEIAMVLDILDERQTPAACA